MSRRLRSTAVAFALLALVIVAAPPPALSAPDEDALELPGWLSLFDQGNADAADGLVKVGAKSVPPLIERLLGNNAQLAARSAEVLGRIGDPAVAPLVAELTPAAVPARVALLGALGRVAANSDAAVAAIVPELAHADAKVRAAAALALFDAGARGKRAGPSLVPLFTDRSGEVRAAAAVS
jgi:HEAT repeat protein